MKSNNYEYLLEIKSKTVVFFKIIKINNNFKNIQ